MKVFIYFDTLISLHLTLLRTANNSSRKNFPSCLFPLSTFCTRYRYNPTSFSYLCNITIFFPYQRKIFGWLNSHEKCCEHPFFNLLYRTYTISPFSNGKRSFFFFFAFWSLFICYLIYLAADLSAIFILLKSSFNLNSPEFRDIFLLL